MFGQMRGSRRQEPSEPCRCHDMCPCHSPQKESIVFLIVGIVMFIAFVSLLVYMQYLGSRQTERHIEVNGQDCIVQLKVAGQTSTGAVRGHDIAICPKE
jgi:hypothetical protein